MVCRASGFSKSANGGKSTRTQDGLTAERLGIASASTNLRSATILRRRKDSQGVRREPG
jgi:hypothetical protein